MTIVFGIDPGSVYTGFGVVKKMALNLFMWIVGVSVQEDLAKAILLSVWIRLIVICAHCLLCTDRAVLLLSRFFPDQCGLSVKTWAGSWCNLIGM